MTLSQAFPLPRYDGRWGLSDSNKRSIAKTFSWRITGTTLTFAISYVVTGSWAIASGIAVVQMFVNTIAYYLHERIWDRIGWGKK